jgi:DUF971 family protein
MSDPYPVEVRREPERRVLRVTWSDDHVSEYPYSRLRGYCPCAACQGHHGTTVRFHEPAAADVHPEAIEAVGNYALSFAWSDRHATGIYRFDLLRSLCPCGACGAGNRSLEEVST